MFGKRLKEKYTPYIICGMFCRCQGRTKLSQNIFILYRFFERYVSVH
jgi:hypothetical protein